MMTEMVNSMSWGKCRFPCPKTLTLLVTSLKLGMMLSTRSLARKQARCDFLSCGPR